MNNNELRRFLKEKVVSGIEKSVSNGIFYSINNEWLNKQKNRTFDHISKVSERYSIEAMLIGFKNSEPNNITILENNTDSFIEFDLNDYSEEYTLFEVLNNEKNVIDYISSIILSNEENKEKLALIENKLNEHKELLCLSEKIKPNERISLWCDNFYKVVESESVCLDFGGYTYEIGFFVENEE